MPASASEPEKGQQICCLKRCCENPKTNTIAEDFQRVEVKAFEPKKKKDKWLVNWGGDGSATFHSTCWELLVKATKGDSDMSANLTDVERSMILEAKKTAEFHDADSTVSKEAARIVSIFKNCGYCIAFTGAGISTAAGIGDFRGKDGKWTRRDRAKNFGVTSSAPPNRITVMEMLRPTYTHEALCKLVEIGLLKFIISQNVDGLHRLSGIPEQKIAELHGNAFTEMCEECGTLTELKRHYSKVKVPHPASKEKCSRCKLPSHRTGRKCTKEACNGHLKNTIINFGDYLETDVLRTAEHHAEMSHAVLIMGSSLMVSPANDLVTMGKQPNRLIICNRQTTSYDSKCRQLGTDGQLGSRVFCDCDKLMGKIMEEVLSPSALQAWEEDRDARMAEYELKRSSVEDKKR